MDGETKPNNNNALIFVLVFMMVLIIGLVVGIIMMGSGNIGGNGDNGNGSDSQNTIDEVGPVLGESEIVYNELEKYSVSDPENLGKYAISYCKEKIDQDNIDINFNNTASCVLFMIDHDLSNEAIEIMDTVDKDQLSTSQLIILYDYYGAAYDKLGDAEKKSEYDTKYQELMNTVREGEKKE